MEKEPNKNENLDNETEETEETEQLNQEELENLEELKEVMKKLEEMSKEQQAKKPRRQIIALEFGGVFHHNQIINFVFTYILTFTIGFFVSELFKFVTYRDIIYFAGAILVFNLIEEFAKTFIMLRYFRIVLRTFGTVFYFVYLLIFYVIDRYIFMDTFSFINEVALPFYVLFLAVFRYIIGQLIRNFLRYRTMG